MCAATTGHLSRRAFEAIVTPAAVGVCPVEDHRAHPRPGRLPRREAALSTPADKVSRTVLGRRRAPMMTSPTGTAAGDNPGVAEVNTAHGDPQARRRPRDAGSRRRPVRQPGTCQARSPQRDQGCRRHVRGARGTQSCRRTDAHIRTPQRLRGIIKGSSGMTSVGD